MQHPIAILDRYSSTRYSTRAAAAAGAAAAGGRFAAAVRDGTYRGRATTVTDTASARGVTGTPTVLVAGKPVRDPDGSPPSAQTLTAAVEAEAR